MIEFSPETSETLFSFIRQLSEFNTSFPQHLLKLFSQYFSCNKALFFPYYPEPVYMEPNAKGASLSNFITLNVSVQDLKAFTDYYYKTDIFSQRNLSQPLQNQKALRIVDVMPYEKFEKTEYCFYLNSVGIAYQACVFLKHKQRTIASISLFRPFEAGDFTKEEVELLAFLSDFVSQQYLEAISNTMNVKIQSVFGKQFDGLDVGVVLLDNQMIVRQANPAARLYSQQAIKNTTGEGFFHKSLRWTESENDSVQTLINELGPSVLTDDNKTDFHPLTKQFSFRSNSFTAIDIVGNIQNLHLLLIQNIKAPEEKESVHPSVPLTARESEVLELVVQGFDNDYVAKQLHMSVYTVRTHVSNIYKKYEVNSKVALLLKINKNW